MDLTEPLLEDAATDEQAENLGGIAVWSTQARPGKTQNEDLVHAGPASTWLLDGASVPRGLVSCCERGAAWYVACITQALKDALETCPDVELRTAVATAIDEVRLQHRAACGVASPAVGPSATLALVRSRGQLLDWLVLGDATLLLNTGEEVVHISDGRLAALNPGLRAQIRSRLRGGGGYDSEEHRRLVALLVDAERAARNTAGGYWIAGDDPGAADHALTGTIAIGTGPDAVRGLALLSDGADRAVRLFGLYPGWRELFAALTDDGPAAVIARVRRAEDDDPHGRAHPRTSRSDDATALLLPDLRGAPPR